MNKQIGCPFYLSAQRHRKHQCARRNSYSVCNTPNQHHEFLFYGVVTATELISTGGLRKELVQGLGFECKISDKSIRIVTHGNIAENLFKNSLGDNF